LSALRQGLPFPTPLTALALSCVAVFALVATLVLVAGEEGSRANPATITLALALGYTLAFGGIGTLAARLVPAPVEARLGLRGFPARVLLPVFLLLPSVLLLSELDNWIRLALGAGSPDTLGQVSVEPVEYWLFWMLLRPVVEEFFFRGVLLQGTVSARGPVLGIALVAGLQALVAVATGPRDLAQACSLVAQMLVSGVLLGWLRLATGSILPGIAFSVSIAGISLAAGAFADVVPIPGYNAHGATTPVLYLLGALVSVALGLRWIASLWSTRPQLPPIPLRVQSDDEEPGPFF
jgi:membrane protease YdiL (CAAX protease family)